MGIVFLFQFEWTISNKPHTRFQRKSLPPAITMHQYTVNFRQPSFKVYDRHSCLVKWRHICPWRTQICIGCNNNVELPVTAVPPFLSEPKCINFISTCCVQSIVIVVTTKGPFTLVIPDTLLCDCVYRIMDTKSKQLRMGLTPILWDYERDPVPWSVSPQTTILNKWHSVP